MIFVFAIIHIPPNVIFKYRFWLIIDLIFRQIYAANSSFGEL